MKRYISFKKNQDPTELFEILQDLYPGLKIKGKHLINESEQIIGKKLDLETGKVIE